MVALERQIDGWINDTNPRQYEFDFSLCARQIEWELIVQKVRDVAEPGLVVALLQQMTKGRCGPLRISEKLADRVHAQLARIAARPDLVCSLFSHPSAAYISDF